MKTFLYYLSRLCFNAILILSATYCLLCFIPFTNHHLIESTLIGWLPTFVKWSPLIYLVGAAFVVLTAVPRRGIGRSPKLTIVMAVALVLFGAYLAIARPLAGAGMNLDTLLLAMLMLLPMVVVAVFDFLDARGGMQWAADGQDEPPRLILAVFVAAIPVALIFTGVGMMRLGDDAQPAMLMLSFTLQLLTAAGIVLLLLTAWSLSRIPRYAVIVNVIALLLAGTAGLSYALLRIVFAPLSFSGQPALLFSLAVAVALGLSVAGAGARYLAASSRPVTGAIDFLLSGMGIPAAGNRILIAGVLVFFLASLVAAAWFFARFDWDYLLQKLLVLVAWVVIPALLFRLLPWRRASARYAVLAGVGLAAAVLGGYRALAVSSAAEGNEAAVARAESWRGYDPAFRLVHDAITPTPLQSANDGLYEFLRKHTNISRAKRTDPVEVNLVEDMNPLPHETPDIFVILIDSLRRDYVGAYNPKVKFTPSVDALAKEGVVFRNAFTRYGASGLSKPSIWVGGMLLHKQYVQPFKPMNSLQELLHAEKYRMLLGFDTTLSAIVEDHPNITRLERGGLNSDLCADLQDVERRLDGVKSPVFVYLQPLNIHVSAVTREGARPVMKGNYDGFYAPYASRMERMDGCIGRFFKYLKSRDRFDSSLIIFASDHGDSLGEEGRWGHAYTLTPEIVRVPIIIKLPSGWEDRVEYDPTGLTFLTDITPSLYYLLGYRPTVNHELFGRPLFTESLEEQKQYLQSEYLVGSSYGPVYGIIGNNGESLYVADAVNFRDQAFTIEMEGEATKRKPDLAESARARKLIREGVEEIADFYKFAPN